MATQIISPEKTAFLKFEIENADARRKKIALQDLCALYRHGLQLNAEGRNAFEKLVNGIILTETDLKVVRWCLNALAKVGHRDESGRYIEATLSLHEDSPEIVAAGISALSKLYGGNLQTAPKLAQVDPVICALASLQHTDPKKLKLDGLRIDINRADDEVLKLALITIGLNRDSIHLFDPKHSNGTFVRELFQHPNPIVRQYSVWSILENEQLIASDLGIRFDCVDQELPNVQSKLYQLAVERVRDRRDRHDIISKGAYASHSQAREGLARGLLQVYYPGLEEVTIEWLETEKQQEILELLCEHFGRFSDDCPPYASQALKSIEIDPRLKPRVLLGCEGKRLYTTIRKQDFENSSLDLFGPGDELSRLINSGTLLKKEERPMKVLAMAASPINEQPLRLDEEARDLQEQLALVKNPVISISVVHRWALRVDQVQAELLNVKPDVLHFSGHGGPGALVFENKIGEAADVDAKAISELLGLIGTIKCLVLNACYSSSVAQECAKHVPVVIGCTDSIRDDAAIAFSRAFYRTLAHGEKYQRAFLFAQNEVRLQFGDQADLYEIAY